MSTVVGARALRGVVLVVLLTVATSMGAIAPASAHAVFVSMTPADGSLQAQPPTQVVVTFDEPIQSIGAAVVVHAPSGASVTDGEPAVVDATVTQHLVPLTETGTYTVAYRVTSTDGHPVTKQLTFAYGSRTTSTAAAAGAGTSSSTTSSSSPVPLLLAVAALVVALVLLLLVRRRRAGPRTVEA
jgi:methionine-rich copper-binding protein CopC